MNTIERLKELEKNATSGPWYYPADGREVVKDKKGGLPILTGTIAHEFLSHQNVLNNFELIAEMRNALPKLLAVVEAAEEIRKCEETDGYGHVGIPDLIEKLKALREEENGTMGFPGSPQGDESWKAKVAEPPAKYRGFGGGIDPREKEQKG